MAFNFSFEKVSSGELDEPDKISLSDNNFSDAINLFKTQREQIGFTFEQLSNETKISRNVLVAIENGWKKYFPEKIYLVSMIKILEIKLNLESGSLNGLLTQENNVNDTSRFKFNFINIDFLNSWTGSFLYVIFMLLSILLLNSQQRYLIKINSVSTEPIIIENGVIRNENIMKSKNEK